MTAPTAEPGGVPDQRDWGAVLASWRLLVNPAKNASQVYELIVGLAAPILARSYHQLRAHPNGRRLLAEKPDLLAVLGDDDYLASLPVGSLGHAYRSFLTTNRLDAGVFSVEEVIRPIAERRGWDDDFFYMIRRGTALHDMFHTLGGYGPDMGGEFGNLGFHCGQMEPSGALKALALSTTGVLIQASPRRKLRYFRQAVRRGQRADNLMAAPYEELLDKPLDEVRALLGVAPTATAHPDGHLFVSWMPPGMTPPTRWDYDAQLRAELQRSA
ncbi:Coq4 family protein [Mycobacterium sp. 1274756.6]|uniref:Coq4 family protein n=1 Tax=Mycobacterium sp. 1274756.6 TaxID=1834076 RepID=UPI0007FC806A|nr:Coq4 family protein [Mycobacterium sp. 1274756.6]OBJ68249.1 hypothetical protein A5643_13965 [Mycobacterium sp. 1274756.6]